MNLTPGKDPVPILQEAGWASESLAWWELGITWKVSIVESVEMLRRPSTGSARERTVDIGDDSG